MCAMFILYSVTLDEEFRRYFLYVGCVFVVLFVLALFL
jgi:hypothetical protein